MSDGMTEMAREEEEMAKQKRINDITPEEWDAMAVRGKITQSMYDTMNRAINSNSRNLYDELVAGTITIAKQRVASDGSTASYYELPKNAAELQDLISYKNMNAQIGEIFRECYRYGQASHSDELRGIKKILFYAQAEMKRIYDLQEGK